MSLCVLVLIEDQDSIETHLLDPVFRKGFQEATMLIWM